MSKEHLETSKKSKLSYHQPKVYLLGSLERIQAYYDGYYTDGPDVSTYRPS
jgi:hypothetical protein